MAEVIGSLLVPGCITAFAEYPAWQAIFLVGA
jgi:hypothetical protein